jgi:hypothetical protein
MEKSNRKLKKRGKVNESYQMDYNNKSQLSKYVYDIFENFNSDLVKIIDPLYYNHNPKTTKRSFIYKNNEINLQKTELVCSICLEDFKQKKTNAVCLPCIHFFHTDCIEKWKTTNSTCPLCKNNF